MQFMPADQTRGNERSTAALEMPRQNLDTIPYGPCWTFHGTYLNLNLNLYTTVAKSDHDSGGGGVRIAPTLWSFRCFQSTIVRTKKEFLNWFVLAARTRKHIEFFVAGLSTMLLETQSVKHLCVVYVVCLLLAVL